MLDFSLDVCEWRLFLTWKLCRNDNLKYAIKKSMSHSQVQILVLLCKCIQSLKCFE